MKAIVTIGIPCSGKSTWAEGFIMANPEWVEINRDNIRKSYADGTLDGYYREYGRPSKLSKMEKKITKDARSQIENAATVGCNIIISDTNLNEKHRKNLIEFLEQLGYEIEIKEFPVNLHDAIYRNDLREDGRVPLRVMSGMFNMWKEYLAKKRNENENKTGRLAYICDIDGTLALMKNRGPYEWGKVIHDEVNKPVWCVLKELHIAGYEIIFVSGRDGCCYDDTRKWLIRHFGDCPLFMRNEGDKRKDYVVKKELYEQHIKGKYKIVGVFDDRFQTCAMWDEEGLPVFRVGGVLNIF